MRSVSQDARYACRLLVKNPGFMAVAVLSLALGIAANSAIFSVVDAVLLQPLPTREPARVVTVNPGDLQPHADLTPVTTDYFRTMDIAPIKGRTFTSQDDLKGTFLSASAVTFVMIDEAPAKRMLLLSLFAGLALALAAVGLYGVMAYPVAVAGVAAWVPARRGAPVDPASTLRYE